jgi:hypothetical protein
MNIEEWLVDGKAEKRQGYTAERGWLLDELNGGRMVDGWRWCRSSMLRQPGNCIHPPG